MARQTREEFLAERRTGIGGSDVHHLFSLKPYGCRRRLLMDKRGIPEDYPTLTSKAMERGIRLEAIAAEVYSEQTGRKTRRMSVRRNKEHPFFLVHIDREIFKISGKPGTGNLEIKVPGQYPFHKIKSQGIDEAYQLQIQHSFLVTGRRWGEFAIFWADGWELLTWETEPDPDILAEIVSSGVSFWKEVENGPFPDRLPVDDRRCRTCPYRYTCQGTELMDLISDEVGGEKEIEEDLSLTDRAAAYVEAKEIRDEANDLFAIEQKKLKDALGERTVVDVPGIRRFYFRPSERTIIDSPRLKKEDPGLFEKYSKKIVSRPLKDYPL